MITISDCFRISSLEESALFVLNKLVYDYKKAYTRSYDGETYWDFGLDINKSVKVLKRELLSQSFRFSPLLLVERQVKSKVRKIYISTWRDKIVERWLNNALNTLLNGWFTQHSYAYRVDGLGLDKCQERVRRVVRSKSYFGKRDIRSYFYSIDPEIMLDKLGGIVDSEGYLFKLLESRVKFNYFDGEGFVDSDLGIPFGSALACTLSNIYLTDLDKVMLNHPVSYFRYADDFLVAADSPDKLLGALSDLDGNLGKLKLGLKPSHSSLFSFVESSGFERVGRFKFLGLVFDKVGKVDLSVEKQRKILGFYRRALSSNKVKIDKIRNLDDRLRFVINLVNDLFLNRIRSVAIIDYYLKHVNDEDRLRMMDRIVAELVISAVLNKKFRRKDFRVVSFKRLRELGLISLVHRHRLHKHGHLKISFMSIRNDLLVRRHFETIERQRNRTNQMRMARKLRGKSKIKKVSHE